MTDVSMMLTLAITAVKKLEEATDSVGMTVDVVAVREELERIKLKFKRGGYKL